MLSALDLNIIALLTSIGDSTKIDIVQKYLYSDERVCEFLRALPDYRSRRDLAELQDQVYFFYEGIVWHSSIKTAGFIF